MMNGKKLVGKKKMMFAFGNAAAAPVQELELEGWLDKKPESQPEETILINSPIFGIFLYYKYYLDLEKYKSVLKFNMDHKAYFKKRDELLAKANDPKLKNYWQACILSFVCV